MIRILFLARCWCAGAGSLPGWARTRGIAGSIAARWMDPRRGADLWGRPVRRIKYSIHVPRPIPGAARSVPAAGMGIHTRAEPIHRNGRHRPVASAVRNRAETRDGMRNGRGRWKQRGLDTRQRSPEGWSALRRHGSSAATCARARDGAWTRRRGIRCAAGMDASRRIPNGRKMKKKRGRPCPPLFTG